MTRPDPTRTEHSHTLSLNNLTGYKCFISFMASLSNLCCSSSSAKLQKLPSTTYFPSSLHPFESCGGYNGISVNSRIYAKFDKFESSQSSNEEIPLSSFQQTLQQVEEQEEEDDRWIF